MRSEFLKFRLSGNFSKCPSSDWKKSNKGRWTKDLLGNHGVPTGKNNNITVFDIDSYKWTNENEFNNFINGKSLDEWVKEISTHTIKTANNGYHLYFKYEEDLKNINNEKFQIDIKNNDGYVVGQGSKVYKKDKKTIGEYELYCDYEVKEMPSDLKKWIQENLYTKKEKDNKKKSKKNKENATIGSEEIYNYDMTDEDIKKLLDGLPNSYFSGTYFGGEWGFFTQAMKQLNKKEIWEEYSKKDTVKFNKQENDKLWNNTKIKFDMVHKLIADSSYGEKIKLLGYSILSSSRYKELPKNILESDLQNNSKINRPKLDKLYNNNNDNDYVKIYDDENYVIKSDTGTGKTTLFKNYIKNNKDLNILSIVSRISLADAQYELFTNNCVENISHYQYSRSGYFEDDENVIITIDSINKLRIEDYSNYVVFVDEFNSVIEYLWTCDNLNNKRVRCLRKLLKIFKECRQFICVDADITSHSLEFLEDVEEKYNYIINEYNHNKGVTSKEIINYNDFIEKAKGYCDKKGVMIPTDTKMLSKIIFEKLTDYAKLKCKDPKKIIKIDEQIMIIDDVSFCLINSDTQEYKDLDEYDVVIFSPKIIYGLDSLRKRPVMAIYDGITINPKQMKQQVARNRNIEILYYHFMDSFKAKYTRYKTKEILIEEINKMEDIHEFKELATKKENRLYKKIIFDILYNEECYKTNKYRHFKLLLKEVGFDDKDLYSFDKSSSYDKDKKKIKQCDLDNFNKEEEQHIELNNILLIPDEEIEKHKRIFCFNYELKKHFNASIYFFRSSDNWKNDLNHMAEFKYNKMNHIKNELLKLKDLLNDAGINDRTKINCVKKYTEEDVKKYIVKYPTLKILSVENINYEFEKEIKSKYTSLFGDNIFSKRRIQIDGVRKMKYTFNKKELNKHLELYRFRNSESLVKNLNYKFGKEDENYLKYEFNAL